ncbi:MAG: M28 family peptidase [Acidobacteriaceae bacterium]|nr:M28 family peptidase [Acidobacteriaceae bacterium]MBV8569686.1 M28 family peptidase [Acidobacteriaceae bacterium]
MIPNRRFLLFALAALACARSAHAQGAAGIISPAQKSVLASITGSELKGDLSFLASDALEGRYTPSSGLDVAAEFIASRFRAAGLKPGGGQDYFQVAHMVDRSMPKLPTPLTAQSKEGSFQAAPESMLLFNASQAGKIDRAPVVVFAAPDLDALNRADVAGKAVVVRQPSFEKMNQDEVVSAYQKMIAFTRQVNRANATVEIIATPQLVPSNGRLLTADAAAAKATPVVLVRNEHLTSWFDHPAEAHGWTLSLEIPAPQDRPAVVKNVIGILPGSEPSLKHTAVLLTAHYDHIGTTDTAGRMALTPKDVTEDHIYNGANDDGSGAVSVIAIARALANWKPRPKRSIVFMTFFGEERGELGSKFYGEHPVFPISDTVADINLEQIGRTDEIRDGKPAPQVNAASLTGFDYSDVTDYLVRAGKQLGISVFKDPEASDLYFTRSDNDALAQQGVPAHTICVAFDYPDYHGLGDEWQKIDYANMARVDRMIALALINLADSANAPHWNASNPKTAPFRQAQQKWKAGSPVVADQTAQ